MSGGDVHARLDDVLARELVWVVIDGDAALVADTHGTQRATGRAVHGSAGNHGSVATAEECGQDANIGWAFDRNAVDGNRDGVHIPSAGRMKRAGSNGAGLRAGG